MFVMNILPLFIACVLTFLGEGRGEEPLPILVHPDLSICSFNIQTFGKNTIRNDAAVKIVVKILRRHDLSAIQEVRDNTGNAIQQLLEKVNEGLPDHQKFRLKISALLGRTHNKEQYAFLYKPTRLSIAGVYQYEDRLDKFERPPYSILFNCHTCAITRFVVSNIHIKPSAARTEIGYMHVVYEEIVRKWNNKNIMFAGDFNSDCDYMKKTYWDQIQLWHNPKFNWLIHSRMDTTIGYRACSYDRFVMAGDEFLKQVIPKSAKVLHYDVEWGTPTDVVQSVSDHYPIEMKIYGRANLTATSKFKTSRSFTVVGLEGISENKIKPMYLKKMQRRLKMQGSANKDYSGRLLTAVATGEAYSPASVVNLLRDFQKDVPGVIDNNMISMVKHQLDEDILDVDRVLNGIQEKGWVTAYKVTVSCELQGTNLCRVEVTAHREEPNSVMLMHQ